MNSSRSAYACFLFAPLFFQQYQAAAPGQEALRCKIWMKVRALCPLCSLSLAPPPQYVCPGGIQKVLTGEGDVRWSKQV